MQTTWFIKTITYIIIVTMRTRDWRVHRTRLSEEKQTSHQPHCQTSPAIPASFFSWPSFCENAKLGQQKKKCQKKTNL